MKEQEGQAAEGYGCSCGLKTLEKIEFTTHLLRASKLEGKGTHKSIGRVNMQTGEVIYPPFVERTQEQKVETIYKVTSKKPKEREKEAAPVRLTETWEQATEFRVIPRVFQMDFTPTMRLAKVASIREWSWNDMPWADFFDTCLYILFKEHGITLAGYIVQEPETEEVAG